MRFTVGTTIEAYGVEPWGDIEGDFIIAAHTTILELESVGIDYYNLRFRDKNKDSLYETYRNNNLRIYAAKPVIRRPWIRNDYDIERTEPFNMREFIYFSDELLDISRTKILQKRTNLAVNLNIGNYNEEKINDEFREKISQEMINSASKFSDKYYVERFITEHFLQPVEESKEEDQTFIDIQIELRRREQEIIDAESARLEALALRENKVRNDEERIVREEQRLIVAAQDLEVRTNALNNFQQILTNLSEQLNVKSESLAQIEYELNQRTQRIYQREIELGLPHTL